MTKILILNLTELLFVDPYMIGLKHINGQYVWCDDSPITNDFGLGNPGNGDYCVAIQKNSTWRQISCLSPHLFMCDMIETGLKCVFSITHRVQFSHSLFLVDDFV